MTAQRKQRARLPRFWQAHRCCACHRNQPGSPGPALPGIPPAEQVRRLLRRGTAAPTVPATHLTVIDGTTRLVNHFSGDGTWVGSGMIDGSALARQSSWAFNAAWALSAPHGRRGPG